LPLTLWKHRHWILHHMIILNTNAVVSPRDRWACAPHLDCGHPTAPKLQVLEPPLEKWQCGITLTKQKFEIVSVVSHTTYLQKQLNTNRRVFVGTLRLQNCQLLDQCSCRLGADSRLAAFSEMTYIVSSGALNSTHYYYPEN